MDATEAAEAQDTDIGNIGNTMKLFLVLLDTKVA